MSRDPGGHRARSARASVGRRKGRGEAVAHAVIDEVDVG
jgi:hypothetical protein